jgi:hypothetical protein
MSVPFNISKQTFFAGLFMNAGRINYKSGPIQLKAFGRCKKGKAEYMTACP